MTGSGVRPLYQVWQSWRQSSKKMEPLLQVMVDRFVYYLTLSNFAMASGFIAGNSSQVTDGAGAVLLMKRSVALQKGLPILGVFRFVPPWQASPFTLGLCGLTFEISQEFCGCGSWPCYHGGGASCGNSSSSQSCWPQAGWHWSFWDKRGQFQSWFRCLFVSLKFVFFSIKFVDFSFFLFRPLLPNSSTVPRS